MSFSSQLATIKPFNGQDFDHYRHSIWPVFQLNKLEQLFEGRYPRPDIVPATMVNIVPAVIYANHTASKKAQRTWDGDNNQALGILMYSLIPSIKILLEGETIVDTTSLTRHQKRYASEVWTWLVNTYDKKDSISVATDLSALLGISLSDGDPIAKLNKFCYHFEQIHVINAHNNVQLLPFATAAHSS